MAKDREHSTTDRKRESVLRDVFGAKYPGNAMNTTMSDASTSPARWYQKAGAKRHGTAESAAANTKRRT